ncbi:hypothetical protein M0802_009317 [Mischocyttarus mexicanus]|nr:hypothetical protein M0802_009317 [Mischocyttarus mexicanus]
MILDVTRARQEQQHSNDDDNEEECNVCRARETIQRSSRIPSAHNEWLKPMESRVIQKKNSYGDDSGGIEKLNNLNLLLHNLISFYESFYNVNNTSPYPQYTRFEEKHAGFRFFKARGRAKGMDWKGMERRVESLESSQEKNGSTKMKKMKKKMMMKKKKKKKKKTRRLLVVLEALDPQEPSSNNVSWP